MLEKFKTKIKKNTEIVALASLIVVTILSTTFYNQSKKTIFNNYKETINNIYLKKTINHIFDNLEPKFKIINHKISKGETFDSILEGYQVNKKEISQIKKKYQKKLI